MQLTKKQEEGLKIAVDRYYAKEKYTVIAGYAGTGKSTLVKFIIEALPVDKNRVCYCAFTGKAVEVLRKKGNNKICTLHKLLYEHIPLASGEFLRKPKPLLEYGVIVVDEVSMVPKDMIDLLFKHNVYVICLGDPFQLPPVNKNEENHLLDNPHIFLDEIMRQAAESEIIQLTMKIRNGEPLNYFDGENVKILPKSDLNTGMLLWADQILVATNATRISVNNQMRELLGYEGLPQEGERLICLRNYWESFDSDGNALVNGTTGTLHDSFESFRMLPSWLGLNINKIDFIIGDFKSDENNTFNALNLDKKLIQTGEKSLDWKTEYRLNKMKKKLGEVVPKEFAFAYAITTHKAQGSEWDKVLVIEERFPFDKEEHARWLYTAATRASEKLVLVR